MGATVEPTPGAEPRLLADEMLGRLARYLRMLGCDVVWGTGATDAELLRRSSSEARRLLTRDRALAARSPGSILLREVRIDRQIREVAAALPELPRAPRFLRCTVCNGRLSGPPDPRSAVGEGADPAAPPIWSCGACGHRYWEGSHTARVRRDVARWLSEGPP